MSILIFMFFWEKPLQKRTFFEQTPLKNAKFDILFRKKSQNQLTRISPCETPVRGRFTDEALSRYARFRSLKQVQYPFDLLPQLVPCGTNFTTQ